MDSQAKLTLYPAGSAQKRGHDSMAVTPGFPFKIQKNLLHFVPEFTAPYFATFEQEFGHDTVFALG